MIAAYYNDLDTFVGTEFPVRPVVDSMGVTRDVTFTTPGNGDGGYIRGFEIAATTSFGFIADALESFGTSVNYANTESNVLAVGAGGAGGAAQLTGLSEDVANLALWWAGNNAEFRIAWDYRSEYTEPTVFGNFVFVDDTLLTTAPAVVQLQRGLPHQPVRPQHRRRGAA